MKLASHIAKSRHGVFYFRLTYRTGSTIKERRVSLGTKDPHQARLKASCLSAIMLSKKHELQQAMDSNSFTSAQTIADNVNRPGFSGGWVV